MSASESTSAGYSRIWAVLDVTDAEAQKWLTEIGRVVDGRAVLPLDPADGARECEHCGNVRLDAYHVADGAGIVAECRACYGRREQVVAIVDKLDELDAIDADQTRVVDR